MGHRWSRSNLRQPQGSPNWPKAAHSGPHDSIFDQIQPRSGSSMQFLPSTSSQVRPCSNVSTTGLCQVRPYNFVYVSHDFIYVSPESGPRSVHSVYYPTLSKHQPSEAPLHPNTRLCFKWMDKDLKMTPMPSRQLPSDFPITICTLPATD